MFMKAFFPLIILTLAAGCNHGSSRSSSEQGQAHTHTFVYVMDEKSPDLTPLQRSELLQNYLRRAGLPPDTPAELVVKREPSPKTP